VAEVKPSTFVSQPLPVYVRTPPVAEEPPRLVRIGGRRSGNGVLGDADLPSLAEVRAALVTVERGAYVSSVTATWPLTVSR
jgi:hypothetical protein